MSSFLRQSNAQQPPLASFATLTAFRCELVRIWEKIIADRRIHHPHDELLLPVAADINLHYLELLLTQVLLSDHLPGENATVVRAFRRPCRRPSSGDQSSPAAPPLAPSRRSSHDGGRSTRRRCLLCLQRALPEQPLPLSSDPSLAAPLPHSSR